MSWMLASPSALEAYYRDYLRYGLAARQADRALQAALRSGDRRDAEAQLLKRWRALKRMRESLEDAWPGLEIFARRELSAHGVLAQDAALGHLYACLRASPPPLSGSRLPVAGLYGFVRRTLREARAACESAPSR